MNFALREAAFGELSRAAREHGVRPLLGVISGSHSYGTARPDSDVDVRGVFLPSVEQEIGLHRVEQIKFGNDGVMHSVRSFVRLALQGNPNILDWVYAPEDCRCCVANEFKPFLTDNRFISRRVVHRILAYANAQKHKMCHPGRTMGEKRRLDIEKYGYSPKNAMHLMRLLRVARHLVETGEYMVRMDDAAVAFSREILDGCFSLPIIQGLAEAQIADIERMADDCDLPAAPDEKFVEQMLVVLQLFSWSPR